MTASFLHPALLFIAGALLVPLLPGRAKRFYLILLPLASLVNLYLIPEGIHLRTDFLGYEVVLLKADRLSFIFGLVFHIVTLLGMVFALKHDDDTQHVFALLYAGAVQGVVFAGDMLSLFLFWETLTITAAVLIWSHRTEQARGAGFRYMLVHAAGGLCLLCGIVLRVQETGSLEFGYIGLTGLSSALIFIGFGINAAWPALHAWLTDAYPAASATGAIFLSAFTTKSAVYVLARAFPGTELLIYIGAVMTAFPIFYAVIENDLRRVLSYSLINQVGFMMVGIGIGTELAINGTCAHAFAHVLYKGLLFMSMGAVLHRTGKINATDLGGLYKSMPWTALFCCIGAASISAFPLTSGFISKSMIISASAEEHLVLVWFALVFASAGVFHHSGIKIPFFAFYGHDAGHRVREAPWNMMAAMGGAAFFCLFLGIYPDWLYGMLPYPVHYDPYTSFHVVAQLQLLFFSALAFTLLMLSGLYPAEVRGVNLDTDLVYRFGGRWFYRSMDYGLNRLNALTERMVVTNLAGGMSRLVQNGPTRLALLAMRPYWAASGLDLEEQRQEREKLARRVGAGGLSLGLGALAIALYAGLLFLLRAW